MCWHNGLHYCSREMANQSADRVPFQDKVNFTGTGGAFLFTGGKMSRRTKVKRHKANKIVMSLLNEVQENVRPVHPFTTVVTTHKHRCEERVGAVLLLHRGGPLVGKSPSAAACHYSFQP